MCISAHGPLPYSPPAPGHNTHPALHSGVPRRRQMLGGWVGRVGLHCAVECHPVHLLLLSSFPFVFIISLVQGWTEHVNYS